ncbi:MAG: hypothetical protein IKA57_02435 [Clostridia bacterium]|nr:hypothetical protein [Clostridia bacterium]
MKKITAYTWAFILAILVFFTVGMFTLGSTKSTGKTMTVLKNTTVYYEIDNDGKNETIESIYLNVGAIHAELGTEATLTVKASNSSSSVSPSSASWAVFGSAIKVCNVSNETNSNSQLYNWVNVASGLSKSAYKISFTSDVALDLNEIVAVNKSGEIVTLKAYAANGYSLAEINSTIDKQGNFARFLKDGKVELSNGAFENLAQEEGYYMSSVQNVLAGNTKIDAVFTLDGNFNYLATILMTPSVAIFGNSAFALRLPAFVATCLLIVFAFLLVKELTKREQFAFYFSLVLMFGGLATTVGRLGAPYVMVASAIVASAYFMYAFFAHGISTKDMLGGALNILVSGLFGAAAIAMDITAILPIAGVAVIYAFGLKRQKKAHVLALEKVTDEKATLREKNAYATKTRLSYGFAALSFGVGTIVLMLFSAVLCYSAYVRAMNNADVNFLAMIWKGIAASFRDNGVTYYTAKNASILSWLIPYRPAALFTGVVNAGEGAYVGWHVLPNIAVLVCSALAFIACTVKVILDLAKKKNDKMALRMRRAYLVLLGGMVLALGAGLLRGNVSALSGMLFHVFYLGFLPLVASLLPEGETVQDKALINVGCITLVAVFALVFILALPVMYGMAIMANRANLFNWMSLFSNGFFK